MRYDADDRPRGWWENTSEEKHRVSRLEERKAIVEMDESNYKEVEDVKVKG